MLQAGVDTVRMSITYLSIELHSLSIHASVIAKKVLWKCHELRSLVEQSGIF